MNDAAYDISHLLELDASAAAMPEFRPARPAVVTVEPCGVAAAQLALANELLQTAGYHEEMIQQYLRMSGDPVSGTDW